MNEFVVTMYEKLDKLSRTNDKLRQENEELKKKVAEAGEEVPEVDIESKIKEFLIANETPTDEQVHDLAEELGVEEGNLEEAIYKMLRAYIMKEQEAAEEPAEEPEETE